MFRVSSHHNAKNLHKENALLLHPSKDNPEEHITFIREKIIPQVMPTGIESEKGKVTINTCGLERPSLNNSREILFNKIIKLKELRLENEIALKLAKEQVIINIINKNIKHYKTEISDLAKSSSEFAGMVRANFPDLPRD
ncbi:MAG: hypothetical protein IPH52_26255 [Leptospiraceae bacterium]|nr:hypothetical protein [Leptospiraceae bacterium]